MLDRKTLLLYLIISLSVIVLINGVILYFLFFKKSTEELPVVVPGKEKTAEEIMQSLTAPSGGEETEVSAQTLKSLSAPGEGGVPPEDILKNLSAPNSK